MIALAGNLYIFAPRITAHLAAVLLAVRNIAAAWNVRAFLILLVYHDNSFDRYCSGFSISDRRPGQNYRRSAPPFSCTDTRPRAGLLLAVFLYILIAIKIPSGLDKQSWSCCIVQAKF